MGSHWAAHVHQAFYRKDHLDTDLALAGMGHLDGVEVAACHLDEEADNTGHLDRVSCMGHRDEVVEAFSHLDDLEEVGAGHLDMVDDNKDHLDMASCTDHLGTVYSMGHLGRVFCTDHLDLEVVASCHLDALVQGVVYHPDDLGLEDVCHLDVDIFCHPNMADDNKDHLDMAFCTGLQDPVAVVSYHLDVEVACHLDVEVACHLDVEVCSMDHILFCTDRSKDHVDMASCTDHLDTVSHMDPYHRGRVVASYHLVDLQLVDRVLVGIQPCLA